MTGSFFATAVWGLAVFVSFLGWGSALGKWLFRERHVDAGLCGAWGMSFAVFVGGVACLLNVASKGLVFAFVGLGLVFAGIRFIKDRVRRSLRDVAAGWGGPAALTLVSLCILGAFVQYLASIGNVRFQVNDDLIAYFPFAKQILQQGTLFDPFSTRRVMSFGGQSFLHAIVLAGCPGFRLHMLDQGICMLLAVFLVIGSRKEGRPGWPVLLALLLLITMPQVWINTYPEVSGVVVFYGLYRTMVWLDERNREGGALPAAAIVSLLATAACALRSNYIATAIPMVGISYICLIWRDRDARMLRLREAGYAAGFGVLFLAPWMVMSYISSGTPLFPILHGHFNDAFPMLQEPTNFSQQWADLMGTVKENNVMRAFPLAVLAGFLLPDRGARKPLRALLICGVLGWVLLIAALASNIPAFLRYVYAFIVAGALAVTTAIAIPVDGLSNVRRTLARIGQTAAVAAALVQLYLVGLEGVTRHRWDFDRLLIQAQIPIRPPEYSPNYPHYRAVQELVSPDQPILVMVDLPFMFDFSRNAIYNVDTAAAVSPPPGFPYFKGPEAVAGYLRQQSIRHVAFTRPEYAMNLFRRDVWEKEKRLRAPLWSEQAPYYLDIFDNFAKLTESRRVLYDDGGLVLIDLAQPAARSAAASRPRAQTCVPIGARTWSGCAPPLPCQTRFQPGPDTQDRRSIDRTRRPGSGALRPPSRGALAMATYRPSAVRTHSSS